MARILLNLAFLVTCANFKKAWCKGFVLFVAGITVSIYAVGSLNLPASGNFLCMSIATHSNFIGGILLVKNDIPMEEHKELELRRRSRGGNYKLKINSYPIRRSKPWHGSFNPLQPFFLTHSLFSLSVSMGARI